MSPLTVHIGDSLAVLRTLPSESVHCCITSPPYWGLRDYGVAGQLGLEANPQEYVAKLVEVFEQVKRVLRGDGTLWLNLGDSYAHSLRQSPNKAGDKQNTNRGSIRRGFGPIALGFKEKDLVGIPWRVAFALQASGWYLRQDIIWAKPNPMPESVHDRCTKAHEYIFLLAKSERYYWDYTAMQEPAVEPNRQRNDRIGGANGHTVRHSPGGMMGASATRNRRSVWTLSTKPYSEAHFATFPPALCEPCILAGCPVGGTVLDPFAGSGTVGQVALDNARFAILIELNPAYAPLIAKRCAIPAPVESKYGPSWGECEKQFPPL